MRSPCYSSPTRAETDGRTYKQPGCELSVRALVLVLFIHYMFVCSPTCCAGMAACSGGSSLPARSAGSRPRIALGKRCNLLVHAQFVRSRRCRCAASANAEALISDEWLSLAQGQVKHGRNVGQKHKVEVKREGNLFFLLMLCTTRIGVDMCPACLTLQPITPAPQFLIMPVLHVQFTPLFIQAAIIVEIITGQQ